METRSVDHLIGCIEGLKGKFSKTTVKILDLNLVVRLVKRLDSFSSECEECRLCLDDIRTQITKLEETRGEPAKEEFRAFHTKINSITSHLQNNHGLVTEGYYTGVYMSTYLVFGMSIGLVFGISVFDNISLGLPIGMGLGIALGAAIGSAKDEEAKKKGRVI
jgi:hypothetical protein